VGVQAQLVTLILWPYGDWKQEQHYILTHKGGQCKQHCPQTFPRAQRNFSPKAINFYVIIQDYETKELGFA